MRDMVIDIADHAEWDAVSFAKATNTDGLPVLKAGPGLTEAV